MTDKIKFFIILLSLLAISFIVYKLPIKLGLDLQGGMRLVLEARETDQVKITEQAMQGIVAVVRNRVDGLGVSEPIISRKGSRQVVVELPGVKDPQRAIKLIGDTALLEFVEAEYLPNNAAGLSTEDLKILGGEESRLAVYTEKQGEKIIRESYYVLKGTVLTGKDLKYSGPAVDEGGQLAISIEFSPKGTKLFADITKKNVGKPLAILLDGKIISAPSIRSPIYGGKGIISGRFTAIEQQDLIVKLNAGSFPVPVEIVEQKEVGPTLGKDSINKSILAGSIAYIFVAIFMLVIYKYLGLIAIVSLLIYLLIDIAVLSFFQVVLTLPGIAGIILSIGMAVDANVLIFERFKEEQRQGKTVLNALEKGFNRAMITILDANITTLITAFVLFWLGTGSIKGFAVTLTIGIIVSIFTALYLTRFFLFSTLKIHALRNSKLVVFSKTQLKE